MLTTFCRNRSNLSHLSLVTSWRKLSIWWPDSKCTPLPSLAPARPAAPWSEAIPPPSVHSEHALVVASADDIDSKPVSLSIYAAPVSKFSKTVKKEIHGILAFSSFFHSLSLACKCECALEVGVFVFVGLLTNWIKFDAIQTGVVTGFWHGGRQ